MNRTSSNANVKFEVFNRIDSLRERIQEGLIDEPQDVAKDIDVIIELTQQLLSTNRKQVN